MITPQMIAARLETLRHEPRVDGGGPVETINGIGGLVDLIKYANPTNVIEIGSHLGISTEVFLLHGIRVTSVDPHPHESIYRLFMERCSSYTGFEHIRERSPQALKHFADGEFDMAYIDGSHFFRDVSADIKACRRVARRWLAGHDYGIADVASAILCETGRRPDDIFSDASWIMGIDAGCYRRN